MSALYQFGSASQRTWISKNGFHLFTDLYCVCAFSTTVALLVKCSILINYLVVFRKFAHLLLMQYDSHWVNYMILKRFLSIAQLIQFSFSHSILPFIGFRSSTRLRRSIDENIKIYCNIETVNDHGNSKMELFSIE